MTYLIRALLWFLYYAQAIDRAALRRLTLDGCAVVDSPIAKKIRNRSQIIQEWESHLLRMEINEQHNTEVA